MIKFKISDKMHKLVCLMHYLNKDVERSGVGKVEKINGVYTRTDIVFPKQKNIATFTSFEDNALEEITEELFDRGEDLSKRNLRFHSHHGMGAFRSGQDNEQRDKLGGDGTSDFRFSIVTSYDNDYKNISYHGTLDVFNPFRLEFDLDISFNKNCLEQKVEVSKTNLNLLKEITGLNDNILINEIKKQKSSDMFYKKLKEEFKDYIDQFNENNILEKNYRYNNSYPNVNELINDGYDEYFSNKKKERVIVLELDKDNKEVCAKQIKAAIEKGYTVRVEYNNMTYDIDKDYYYYSVDGEDGFLTALECVEYILSFNDY